MEQSDRLDTNPEDVVRSGPPSHDRRHFRHYPLVRICTAATLNAHGTTKIETAAQAAEALRPIAGELTFAAICGRHHRHLTSGSANSRRVGGLCRCRVLRVARKPRIAGRSSTWLLRDRRRGHTRRRRTCRHEYRPYRHAFWTAAINGVVAVPIMLAMMLNRFRSESYSASAVAQNVGVAGNGVDDARSWTTLLVEPLLKARRCIEFANLSSPSRLRFRRIFAPGRHRPSSFYHGKIHECCTTAATTSLGSVPPPEQQTTNLVESRRDLREEQRWATV